MRYFFILAFMLTTVLGRAQTVWSTDVAPILYQHCTACHHEGGIGIFSLMTYSQAAVTGPLIAGAVNSGEMPPWPPDANYSNFAHERVLSAEQVATLNAWVAQGMLEGDPALAPPPPVYSTDGFISLEPDLEIIMPMHTSAATATSDDYSCFAIPTGLMQNKKLRAFEVIPGNPSIVHHALVFVDPSANYPTNTSGFCMGPNEGLLGAFTPGAVPTIFPSDGEAFNLGATIPAGANMVLAMHYPHGSAGQTDQTRLRMWFYPDEVSIREVSTAPIIENWAFFLPANQLSSVNAQFNGIPADISFLSVFPHMHMLGKSIESHATTPEGTTIPLIQIPDWDFHWQQFYTFPQLVRIPAGSTLHGSAVYDNTADNPNNPNNPPQGVGPGLNTSDEMFLIYYQFLPYQPGDENMNLEALSSLPTHVGELPTSAAAQVQVAPNPASDRLAFTLDLQAAAMVSLYLYDLNGRMVDAVTERSILPAGSNRLEYNVRHLAPGMYVYSALIGGKPASGRVIVQ